MKRPGSAGIDMEGNYYDPWGTMYEVYMDGDYNTRIQVPARDEELRGTIGVRSAGIDKIFGDDPTEKDDDVTTWN